MPHESLTPVEIEAAGGLGDWRVLLRSVQAEFRAPGYGVAAALVGAIAALAERHGRHPTVVLRHPGSVRVVLSTEETGGLPAVDVDLAGAMSQLASEHGAVAMRSVIAELELAIDTMDVERIRPFWAAVLDYREEGDTLVDPHGVGPVVWFQQMDTPRTDRNRLHVDVTVPHDHAAGRVAAAITAGGRLVSDAHARSWWVLADADGNEACVCTWQDRT